MNETDYNARLYEKMKAEQDKYRDWLLHQEPSEILNHTYEYTMREDIVMCMEELELEPEKARALLRSPCPLSDVYKEFRDRETEHMDTIRDSIETEADKSVTHQNLIGSTLPLEIHGDDFDAKLTGDPVRISRAERIDQPICRLYDLQSLNIQERTPPSACFGNSILT